MHTNKSLLLSCHVVRILYCLAVVGLGALFFTVPVAHDDYWYLHDLTDGGTDRYGNFDFWQGVWECARRHHLYDNSRIPNFFGGILVYLPRWITQTVSLISVALTLLFMSRLSGISKSNVAGFTLLATIYIFLMPWTDYLFTGMFAYNYVWAGALMTGAVVVFLRRKPVGAIWAFMLGLLLGAWHEIFSFPVFCAAVACLAVYPRMIRRDRVWMCVGLLLGGLWLFLSPSRTSAAGYGSLLHYSRPFVPLFKDHILTFSFWILEIICIAWRRTRREALSPVMFFCVSASLVSFGIHLLSYGPRTCVPGVIMEGVGIVALLQAAIPYPRKPIRYAALTVCGIAWLFITAHFVAAFITGIKINREERHILALYQEAKDTDGEVFADVTRSHDALWLTFGKPYQGMYDYHSHPDQLSTYFHGKRLKVLPAALENYRKETGTKLKGDAGFYVYHGALVAPIDSDYDEPTYWAEFIYGDRSEKKHPLAYSFTGADSRHYLFVLTETEGLTAVNLFHP